MEPFIVAIGMIILAVFGLLANQVGVDTRDLSDDPQRAASSAGVA